MAAHSVRVRFAPSPTGMLHVGNARTALFNWLYARHHGGKFVLRIEDTDLDRSEARHETQLIEDLRWMGLAWDEGPSLADEGPYAPYRQSERLAIYHEHTEQLLAEGKAYRCFCTAAELEAERASAIAEHRPQVYSGRCRALAAAASNEQAATGQPFAVRLKIPDHPLRFHDLVRGTVEFAQETVSDPILVRSSGMPVYNYVVTVDDALMQITHVIRGDDHISNTPKQVAIYEAFGWPVPEFAHLSTILGSDRERLSKRHGATSIASFREMGILPEALTNYLALLGWGAEGGTQEIFSASELVRAFALERVTASPAVFDFEKLRWMNRHYLKERMTQAPQALCELAAPYLAQAGWLGAESAGAEQESTLSFVELLLQAFLPSLDQLDQLAAKVGFVFAMNPAETRLEPENAEILNTESAQKVIAAFKARVLAHHGPVTPADFKVWMNEVKTETGVKGKELFHPVRILLTGSHSGPEFDRLIPIFELGSTLSLPVHVMSVRERAEAFL